MFEPGQTVVLREVLHGRIRSARPLRVIADDDNAFVGFLTPRSAVAWPRLIDREQSQTPDQGWRLADEVWQGPGSLFVIPEGEAFAAVLFFDPSTGEPLSWKVDFLLPPRRTTMGLDTLDTALDLLAPFDLSSWEVKDTDDFAQLGRIGVLDRQAMSSVAEARGRAEDLMATRAGPFDERWRTWRPDPGWQPLEFPAGWDVLEEPVGLTASENVGIRRSTTLGGIDREERSAFPNVVRSALGSEIIDAEGRVWADFDLGRQTLPLGHNHPAVVEAVTRQLSLLHRHPVGVVHEASVVVAERLLDRVGRAKRVRLTRSGHDAQRLASATGVGFHDARVDLGVGTSEPLVVFGEEHASGWPFGAVVGPADIIDALDFDALDTSSLGPDPVATTAALETLNQLSAERVAGLRERTKRWAEALASVGESVGFRVDYPGGWSLRLDQIRAELPLSVALESRSIIKGEDLVFAVAETTSDNALATVEKTLKRL